MFKSLLINLANSEKRVLEDSLLVVAACCHQAGNPFISARFLTLAIPQISGRLGCVIDNSQGIGSNVASLTSASEEEFAVVRVGDDVDAVFLYFFKFVSGHLVSCV